MDGAWIDCDSAVDGQQGFRGGDGVVFLRRDCSRPGVQADPNLLELNVTDLRYVNGVKLHPRTCRGPSPDGPPITDCLPGGLGRYSRPLTEVEEHLEGSVIS